MRPGQRGPTAGTRRDWIGHDAGRLFALAALVVVAGCGSGEARDPSGSGAAQEGPSQPLIFATEEDWDIVRRKVEWGRSNGLDTLAVGEAMARLGGTFVGTPYLPRTLEVEGPERLVVNLRALDCVTFVETVLALVHVIREPTGSGIPGAGARRDGAVEAEAQMREAYRRALTRIRYRDGVLDGYHSRLHYFSEWVRDAVEKNLVRDVTGDLGGVPDAEPVDFMTEHPDAYRQLDEPRVRDEIRRIEERISRTPRIYLPEERIAENASSIRDGDIIAATSTAAGLDVAHTGLALWRDGRLHLLHAPLVGDSVQISERSLARRIVETEGQDGILVARPAEPGSGTARRD